MKEKYHFSIMSYDYKALQTAINIYKKSFEENNMPLKGPIYIPTRKTNLVLMRSPHVNKASREVFYFKKYKSVLVLNHTKNILDNKKSFDLNDFLKKMCLLDIAGVSVRILRSISS